VRAAAKRRLELTDERRRVGARRRVDERNRGVYPDAVVGGRGDAGWILGDAIGAEERRGLGGRKNAIHARPDCASAAWRGASVVEGLGTLALHLRQEGADVASGGAKVATPESCAAEGAEPGAERIDQPLAVGLVVGDRRSAEQVQLVEDVV